MSTADAPIARAALDDLLAIAGLDADDIEIEAEDLARDTRIRATEAAVAALGAGGYVASRFMGDSAVLGTLHELVESAEKTVAGSKVKIQDASHSLVRTFAELGLNSVLRSLQMQSIAIPKTRTAVRVSYGNLRGQQMRLLKAHEVLASLNDTNRDQFALVVDDLREHFTYLSGMTSPR